MISPNLLLRTFIAVTLASGTLHAADYFPPPDSSGGWPNAAQIRELAAMDLPRLEQAWEFTQRCTTCRRFIK